MRTRVKASSLSAVLLALAIIPGRASVEPARALYAATLKDEAARAGLPVDVADAVMAIESGYDPGKIGGVGEIGLMQVLPTTAAMLGFRGSLAELARPEVNIHFGVTYLAEAWRQANGDLCRALMKYRAGHGEEMMTPLSVTYCQRARAHLVAVGSTLPLGAAPVPSIEQQGMPAKPFASRAPSRSPLIGMSSAAFWAAHKARIARINASIERRWRRVAAR